MKFSELDGLSIGLWGLGRETASFARHARDKLPNATLSVVATDDPVTPSQLSAVGLERARQASGAAIVGALEAVDIVVRSPGVSVHRPELKALRSTGLPIVTATGLWMAERPARPVVGVTGTKGKSTTASLIALLARSTGSHVLLAGNVGSPALDLLDEPVPDLYVLELSSYQIADLTTGPSVAVFTNLYDEHLDWHGSHEAYAADKLRLAELPGVNEVIVNGLDTRLRTLLGVDARRVATYGLPPGFHVSSEGVRVADRLVVSSGAVPLRGDHNLLNLCAALSVLEALDLEVQDVGAALSGFTGLPHRLEVVAARGSAIWVDDSISTTPESTLAALDAFSDHPIILIAGGFERGQNYERLGSVLAERKAVVIALPTTGHRLLEEARKCGLGEDRLFMVESLPQAVAVTTPLATEGAVVLLSPAAPSFGAYPNFEARGHHFRELVAAARDR